MHQLFDWKENRLCKFTTIPINFLIFQPKGKYRVEKPTNCRILRRCVTHTDWVDFEKLVFIFWKTVETLQSSNRTWTGNIYNVHSMAPCNLRNVSFHILPKLPLSWANHFETVSTSDVKNLFWTSEMCSLSWKKLVRPDWKETRQHYRELSPVTLEFWTNWRLLRILILIHSWREERDVFASTRPLATRPTSEHARVTL